MIFFKILSLKMSKSTFLARFFKEIFYKIQYLTAHIFRNMNPIWIIRIF
jgi:hypothetical protein